MSTSEKPKGWKPNDDRTEEERENQGPPVFPKPEHSRFTDDSGLVVLTPCATCKHRSADNPLDCAAFPDGIPEVILSGDNQHREPFPGDHGITWEPR